MLNETFIMRYGYGLRKRRRSSRRSRVYSRASSRRTRVSRAISRRQKSRRFNRPSSVRIRQLTAPDSMFVKLRYHTQNQLSGLYTYNNQNFRGNSVFDPDETYVGHQPTGFDQYAALFNKYIIYGSKITVKYIQNRSATSYNFYIIPAPVAGTPGWLGSVGTDPLEQPYAKGRLIAANGVANNDASGVMKHYMSTKKMFGIKGELSEEFYASTTATNPTRVWSWILYQTVFGFNDSLAPAAATLDMYYDIKITYYCKFFDRVTVAKS